MNNKTKLALVLFTILFVIYGHSSILNFDSEYILHNQIDKDNYTKTIEAPSPEDAESLINEHISKSFSNPSACKIIDSQEITTKLYEVKWLCTYDIIMTKDRYMAVSLLLFVVIMVASILYLGRRMTEPLHFLVVIFVIGGLLTWLFWTIIPIYFEIDIGYWDNFKF